MGAGYNTHPSSKDSEGVYCTKIHTLTVEESESEIHNKAKWLELLPEHVIQPNQSSVLFLKDVGKDVER